MFRLFLGFLLASLTLPTVLSLGGKAMFIVSFYITGPLTFLLAAPLYFFGSRPQEGLAFGLHLLWRVYRNFRCRNIKFVKCFTLGIVFEFRWSKLIFRSSVWSSILVCRSIQKWPPNKCKQATPFGRRTQLALRPSCRRLM
jgi:hypothetical protein